MEWLRRRKYTVLLASLAFLTLLYPPLEDFVSPRIGLDVLRAVFFLIAFLAVFETKGHKRMAVLIGGPAVVMSWLYAGWDGPDGIWYDIVYHLLAVVFLAYTVMTILSTVYFADDVTTDNVFGAFCSYLLIGVLFGHAFAMLEMIVPGSFRVEDPQLRRLFDADQSHSVLTYFSFITLTTVGYGDISPNTTAARSVAVFEAIVGQFYIAVLVAELIGRRVSQSVDSRHSEE